MWLPTAVFLPGKSHRQEPRGLQSMGLDLLTEQQQRGLTFSGLYRMLQDLVTTASFI